VKTSSLASVSALHKMDTPMLKAMWKDLLPDQPLRHSRDYLISRLSFRVQELSHGSLSAKAKRKLDKQVKQKKPSSQNVKADMPPVGTKLIRYYQGIEYQATILADGFEYQGQKYKSLSKVARTITGTQWSGPAFFGLKKGG
jgi:hypothetical protein